MALKQALQPLNRNDVRELRKKFGQEALPDSEFTKKLKRAFAGQDFEHFNDRFEDILAPDSMFQV